MLSTLLSEKSADAEVIKSLQRTIHKLMEESGMGQVVKTADGRYFRLGDDAEELTPDQVTEIVARRQVELQALEAIAPGADAPQPPADAPAAPEAPAAPVAPPTPPDASALGPTDPNAQQAPAQPAAPADAQVQVNDAAPADPNAVPAEAPTLQ